MQGSDIGALIVAAVMILAPMAAGAKKGIDENVTRDTPVVASPAAMTAPTPAPATAPAASQPAAPK